MPGSTYGFKNTGILHRPLHSGGMKCSNFGDNHSRISGISRTRLFADFDYRPRPSAPGCVEFDVHTNPDIHAKTGHFCYCFEIGLNLTSARTAPHPTDRVVSKKNSTTLLEVCGIFADFATGELAKPPIFSASPVALVVNKASIKLAKHTPS